MLPYLVILTVILWYARDRLRFIYLTTKIQGPSVWELAKVRTTKLMAKLIRANFYEMCQYYSFEPWGFWTMTGDYAVVVSDVQSVSEVFQSKAFVRKPQFIYSQIADYLGEGSLALRDVERWRLHRKAASPAFQKTLLESNMHVLADGGDKIVREFSNHADGADFDIGPVFGEQFTDVTLRFLVGESFTLFEGLNITTFMGQALKLIHAKTVNPIRHWLRVKFHKATRDMEKDVRERLCQVRNLLSQYVYKTSVAIKEELEKEPVSALECSLRYVAKKGLVFEDKSIVEECLTIGAAGIETTRSATKMVVMLLSLHQDIQLRVFEELEGIFGDSLAPPTPKDLDRMEYLEMVIKEAMRLFPPSSMIAREADQETILNGTIIPKGAIVIVMISALQRNPDNFKDPLKFIPERFLPEFSKNRLPYSFIPFSSGIRNCVGKPQAMMFMKMMLSSIFRRYQVLPGDGINSVDDLKLHIKLVFDISNSIVKLVPRK